MPQNRRSQKKKARKRAAATGQPYSAAASGTGHQHLGPEIGTLDGRPWGVDRQVNMRPIQALIGAAMAGCLPCQRSATPAILGGDRLAVAAVAGMPLAAMSKMPASALASLSAPSRRLWEANQQMITAGDADGSRVRTMVEEMSEADLAVVLDDALSLWAGMAELNRPRHDADGLDLDGQGHLDTWSSPSDGPDEELTRVPDNPFAAGGFMVMSAQDLAAGFPLPLLLQAAIDGTVEDRITEHAEDVFDTLDERGAAAWREAALLLVQFLLCGGYYGVGHEAAARYLAQQPAPDERIPSTTAFHLAVASFMATGARAADRVLAALPSEVLAGTTRLLFFTAVGSSGYPKALQRDLFKELCADVH
ncbi:hypothetical protein ACFWXO_16655 [Kitasatospora sp. NPDC059088]|uniref:hypothetical protein n=1 Tax=Kitasatospora sp. NPDC059088 TaxID=3346722 RepID=UPI0036C1B497